MGCSHTHTHTRCVDSDCPQQESEGNAKEETWQVSLQFIDMHINIYYAAKVTCVDVRELVLLEFLLFFLFCFLSRQLGPLDLLFSLLSFLILLHCLLLGKEVENILSSSYINSTQKSFKNILHTLKEWKWIKQPMYDGYDEWSFVHKTSKPVLAIILYDWQTSYLRWSPPKCLNR